MLVLLQAAAVRSGGQIGRKGKILQRFDSRETASRGMSYPCLYFSQKRKRSPTVGANELRWMKPFAKPPFTCENINPA
jgi:hypothetical protein